jgi:hypothetical protein
MENMAQPNFGEECRAELAKRQHVVKNDYRWGACAIQQLACRWERLLQKTQPLPTAAFSAMYC